MPSVGASGAIFGTVAVCNSMSSHSLANSQLATQGCLGGSLCTLEISVSPGCEGECLELVSLGLH